MGKMMCWTWEMVSFLHCSRGLEMINALQTDKAPLLQASVILGMWDVASFGRS